MNIKKRIRNLETRRRNFALWRCRIQRGLLMLFFKPWTLIVPLVLIAFSALVCHNVDKIPLPGNTIPEMIPLWEISIALLTITLTALLLCGLLVMLGTPTKAKSTEAALVHIALVDRYGIGPALVSKQRIKGTSVTEITFYSRGIAREQWEKKQRDIEDVLTCHFVAPIQYGRNSNYIVLTVAPGVKEKKREPLYDDEI